jgi:hypothetical protein
MKAKAHIAVRKDNQDGKEWLDLNSLDEYLGGCKEKVKHFAAHFPRFHLASPVTRYVEVVVTTKEGI